MKPYQLFLSKQQAKDRNGNLLHPKITQLQYDKITQERDKK